MTRIPLAVATCCVVGTSANALPDGSYLISSGIFDPVAATPRYVHIDVNGNEIDATFLAFFSPDSYTCHTTELCTAIWPGLHMELTDDGIIATRTRSDMISTSNALLNSDMADDLLYIGPLVNFLKTAELDDDRIHPMSRDTALGLRGLIMSLDVSVSALGGCDIRQLSQIEEEGMTGRLQNALAYFRYQAELADLHYLLSPHELMTEAELDAARAKQLPIRTRMTVLGMITAETAKIGDFDTAVESVIEAPFIAAMLDQSGLTADDIIALVPDFMPDGIAYYQNVVALKRSNTDIVEAVCADITLGL
ncbi:hypothetical protein BVC71_06770 [Marivivens niveibacter]|uniref:SsuA/THI5-like domain-containing protein n=1 Tax=Marivivens niveibacter TaxID=1930667 RepID=A0A251WYM2_9RHOB|nr:hypothetical protein [Marivivens niveibacter]OUD09547.1 hypothetical protein BVC71_06770 [Marivivens niveibacter]